MSININSKKHWHPSRFEVREQVKRFKDGASRAKSIDQQERMRLLSEESPENILLLNIVEKD